MNINNTINTSLQAALLNYFNTLSEIGYVEYQDVYKLIVLDLINDIVTLKLSKYGFPSTITEEDLRLITTTFFNLVNSTFLIPVPVNNNGSVETLNSYYLDLTYLYKYIDQQDIKLQEKMDTQGTNLTNDIDAISTRVTTNTNDINNINSDITNINTSLNTLSDNINNVNTTLSNEILINKNSITAINSALNSINISLADVQNTASLLIEALASLTERVVNIEKTL